MKYPEPISFQMIQIAKKYLSNLSEATQNLPIERYYYSLLLIDEYDEKLTQKELSNLIHVDKSFMVSMIDYLTKNGFVYRGSNQEDKRQCVIKLTEKAKEHIPLIANSIKNLNKKAFEGLSEQQIADFNSVLSALQNNLIEAENHQISFEVQKNRNL